MPARDEPFPPPRLISQPNTLPVPIVWSAHTTEDAALLLEELDVWVNWLIERYRLDQRTIPECWFEHPELLEEISALHLAWEGAYATTAAPDAPLSWHEHFAAARDRVISWVARSGCRPGAHR